MIKVSHEACHVGYILMLASFCKDRNPVWKQLEYTTNISIVHHLRKLQVKQSMLLLQGLVLKPNITFTSGLFAEVLEIPSR